MPMPSDNSFSAVIKVHILPRTEDIPKFERTMEQYRQGCNHVSEYIFEHDFDKMTAHTCDFSHELAVPILLCRNNK